MKQQLLKPENWQDFEELCKILWGEIWQCQEIKKNGRSGQDQKGVDIFGIPKGDQGYYGIQCKGKDEYSKAVLTTKEIDTETEKAKLFKPALKKLYFATTANKDEKLEEYVRIKNSEHMAQGIFEIHLFSWEDIVHLIELNKRAYDWYVRKLNFVNQYKVVVNFDNDQVVNEFSPELINNHVIYKYRKAEMGFNPRYYRSPDELRNKRIEIDTEVQPIRYYINGASRNKGTCVFAVKLKNIGSQPLENFKLYLHFDDVCYRSEIVYKQRSFIDSTRYEYNISWIKDTGDLLFTEQNGILVQNDELVSDKICLRPDMEHPFCVIVRWKLVAKDFTFHGNLGIVLNTAVSEEHTEESYTVKFPNETRLENQTVSFDEE